MTHPHHAPIRELYVSPEAASALGAEAEKLRSWTLDERQAGELALLMNGGFAPLRGYMTQADHQAVGGGGVAPWPVALALQVGGALARDVRPGDDIALRDGAGTVLAILSVTDRWGDPVLLGGKVKGLGRPAGNRTPNALRALFRDQGAGRVLAVQPDHPDQVGIAADQARRLDALLLVQTLPGVVVDVPVDAVLAPLSVAPPPGPQAGLWQGMVARNHGATHLMLTDAAARQGYRPHQDRIGVRMVNGDAIL